MDTQGNKIMSDNKTINCGVPQGSVLGPLLFLIYVNDLKNASDIFRVITFADDTNLFLSNTNLEHLCSIANTELTNISNWFICNRLCLNISKTSYQLYNKKLNDITPHPIKINNVEIKREKVVKFLGVLVDENLSFKEQIDLICKKKLLLPLDSCLEENQYSRGHNS